MKKDQNNDSKKLQKRSSQTDDINKKNDKSKDKQISFETQSDKLIHQILPFVHIVIAVLLETCLILASIEGTRGLVGPVGDIIRVVFLGVFGWSAFLIPVVLINLAVNWRRFIDSKTVVSKTIFSLLFLISLSALIHIFVKQATNDIGFWSISKIWMLSGVFQSGGFLGGLLGEASYLGLNFVGSLVVLLSLVLIFFIFSLI